jgi:hypothetical protein
MKIFTFLIGLFFTSQIFAQCNGVQSFTLTPAPINNQYNPGDVVQVCYTMVGFTEVQANWLEGFDLTLGPGWSNVSPLTPPNNCGGGGGNWIWKTSVTSSATGNIFGPGYFFNLNNINDNNPGNDFGDQNIANCTWSFCFILTASNTTCSPQSLLIQVTAGGDGTMGSWVNNSCSLTPFTIFNGTLNASTSPILSLISHN